MKSDQDNGKIYFASDLHLGVPDHDSSLQREIRFIKWLNEIKMDAKEIFMMGDVFDFWFEYKTVIPRGYARLFGKLAEITDAGIPVHLFRGNHDIWAFNYLKKELNIKLHRKSLIRTFNGKKFYLAHGDGLGPGDKGYKFLKKVFECRFNQWLFRWLHPDLGARMGLYFSRRSRIANIIKEGKEENNIPLEKEMLYQFAIAELKEHPDINYFIFGHRHKPLLKELKPKNHLCILGDWITHFTYAVFDGESLELKYYQT